VIGLMPVLVMRLRRFLIAFGGRRPHVSLVFEGLTTFIGTVVIAVWVESIDFSKFFSGDVSEGASICFFGAVTGLWFGLVTSILILKREHVTNTEELRVSEEIAQQQLASVMWISDVMRKCLHSMGKRVANVTTHKVSDNGATKLSAGEICEHIQDAINPQSQVLYLMGFLVQFVQAHFKPHDN